MDHGPPTVRRQKRDQLDVAGLAALLVKQNVLTQQQVDEATAAKRAARKTGKVKK